MLQVQCWVLGIDCQRVLVTRSSPVGLYLTDGFNAAHVVQPVRQSYPIII